MRLALPSSLAPSTICLIEARISLPSAELEVLSAPLSQAERDRAARFIRLEDNLRHTVGRGVLRHALAHFLGVPAASFQFSTGEAGKPYLPDGPAFNVSHSADVVLIALAPEGRIGIDIEKIRPLRDIDGLARTSFAEDELAALHRLAPDGRAAAFFRVWTRKEALLKAVGHGIGALSEVSVDPAEGAHNTLLRLDSEGEQLERWTVRTVPAPPEYEAALAWDRPVGDVVRLVL